MGFSIVGRDLVILHSSAFSKLRGFLQESTNHDNPTLLRTICESNILEIVASVFFRARRQEPSDMNTID